MRTKSASLLLVCAVCSWPMGAVQAADKLPEFSVISQTVAAYFGSLPGHQPGDLVTQTQVDAALERVEEVGWEVPDRAKVVQLALSDNSFLVRELSKPAGLKFMRKISGKSGGYVRLDRLSEISGGKKVVRQLIHKKGGYEFIDYLATTKSGANLGRMMIGAQDGVDLNKPTGRIYTADDLVAVLWSIYSATAR